MGKLNQPPKMARAAILVLLLLVLLLLLFTSIGVAIVAATGWLLTVVTSLAFFQAALVAGATGVMVIYLARRELVSNPFETTMLVIIITPLATLSFMAVAWVLDRLTPLDFWQATLMTTGVGLAVLFGLATYMSDFSFRGEYVSDDEDETLDEQDWEEEDWEDEDMEEETEWATVGRNDPCPCGSGRKYKYCHGRNLKVR
jgi:hypothetical protein